MRHFLKALAALGLAHVGSGLHAASESQLQWSAKDFPPCTCGDMHILRRTVYCELVTADGEVYEVARDMCSGDAPSTVKMCSGEPCEEDEWDEDMDMYDSFSPRARFAHSRHHRRSSHGGHRGRGRGRAGGRAGGRASGRAGRRAGHRRFGEDAGLELSEEESEELNAALEEAMADFMPSMPSKGRRHKRHGYFEDEDEEEVHRGRKHVHPASKHHPRKLLGEEDEENPKKALALKLAAEAGLSKDEQAVVAQMFEADPALPSMYQGILPVQTIPKLAKKKANVMQGAKPAPQHHFQKIDDTTDLTDEEKNFLFGQHEEQHAVVIPQLKKKPVKAKQVSAKDAFFAGHRLRQAEQKAEQEAKRAAEALKRAAQQEALKVKEAAKELVERQAREAAKVANKVANKVAKVANKVAKVANKVANKGGLRQALLNSELTAEETQEVLALVPEGTELSVEEQKRITEFIISQRPAQNAATESPAESPSEADNDEADLTDEEMDALDFLDLGAGFDDQESQEEEETPVEAPVEKVAEPAAQPQPLSRTKQVLSKQDAKPKNGRLSLSDRIAALRS